MSSQTFELWYVGYFRLILWLWGTESLRMSKGEKGRMKKERDNYNRERRRHLAFASHHFWLYVKRENIYNTGK